jgi:flagellar protein FliS
MLYDGALAAIHQAQGDIANKRTAKKCAALTKATRIVEQGLKASLNHKAGGVLAQRLDMLYDYVLMRLLQANLRNDEPALHEVVRLLTDLRAAWAQIAPRAAPAPTPATTAKHSSVASADTAPARKIVVSV